MPVGEKLGQRWRKVADRVEELKALSGYEGGCIHLRFWTQEGWGRGSTGSPTPQSMAYMLLSILILYQWLMRPYAIKTSV